MFLNPANLVFFLTFCAMTDPPPNVAPPKTELAIQAPLCCRDERICFVETADAVKGSDGAN